MCCTPVFHYGDTNKGELYQAALSKYRWNGFLDHHASSMIESACVFLEILDIIFAIAKSACSTLHACSTLQRI